MPDLRILLLQIVVICLVSRVLGKLFAGIHQPRVVGEIVAGILLGPSLLGWLSPPTMSFLFPPQALGPLYSLSQLGLILFMFQVGMELDLGKLRNMGRVVVITSNVSILIPFLGGAVLAFYLHPRLSSANVPISLFALFMGTAMSITAFPVLARILTERNLVQTRIGSIAISCAAVDDITAWCLLALISVKVRAQSGAPLWLTFGGLLLYAAFMFLILRPLLSKHAAFKGETISNDTLAFVLLLAFLSAWTTEWLGVHALFGAFLAGVILPKTEAVTESVVTRLGTMNTVVLLPLFFAFTGLRTSVSLISADATLWFYCALIILVAVLGKLSGCLFLGFRGGVGWRDALSIGILMNTRGLVELVILNVGLDLGLISPTVFSMMVIMALVTTFMATPLLDLLDRRRSAEEFAFDRV